MGNWKLNSLEQVVMKKKYKIVHIITRLDGGGSAQDTIQTVLGIDKEKYEVILVKGPTYESKMSKQERAAVLSDLKEARSKGVKIVNINFLIRRINPVYDLLSLLSLYKFLIKESPSIVHTHTSKAGIIGRLAAFLSRVPIIVHTPHGHVFFGYFGFFKTKLFISMERIISYMTDKIIAVSSGEKRDYVLLNIANEDKWLEFVPINLGHWESANLRKMSEEIGLKETYDKFYNYTSGFIHANWGGIRESVFEKCLNPLHRFHNIPTATSLSFLSNVTDDSLEILNNILECLSIAYPKFTFRINKSDLKD